MPLFKNHGYHNLHLACGQIPFDEASLMMDSAFTFTGRVKERSAGECGQVVGEGDLVIKNVPNWDRRSFAAAMGMAGWSKRSTRARCHRLGIAARGGLLLLTEIARETG